MRNIPPPRSDKLYRLICDSVLASLHAGEVTVGDRLPTEREFAERFNVGRTTVREAMVALELLGVVEMRKGSGIYVLDTPKAGPSFSDLDIGAFELMEARRLVEGETAALAAVSITDSDLVALSDLLSQMHNPNELEAEIADRAFHQLIAQATGNSVITVLTSFLWDLRDQSDLARNILSRARGLGYEARIFEHEQILDALRAHDPNAARLAMRTHLDRVIQHLLTMTESDALEAARAQSQEFRHRVANRKV